VVHEGGVPDLLAATGGAVAAGAGPALGVEDPSVGWRRVACPIFGNALSTLELEGRGATLSVECAKPDGRSSRMAGVTTLQLASGPLHSV
jgi:hypothetical protein